MKRNIAMLLCVAALAAVPVTVKAQSPDPHKMIKNLYTSYTITKSICEVGGAGTEGYMASLNQKMKAAEQSSKAKGIDTEKAWKEGSAIAEQTDTYIMMKLYAQSPISPQERIPFYQKCLEVVTEVATGADWLVAFNAGKDPNKGF